MNNSQNFSGLWHNKYGSLLELEVNSNDQVSGRFKTAVGRDETKSLWQDQWFNVLGFVNGELISLVVNYAPASQAISTINGILSRDENNAYLIETLSYTRFNLSTDQKWREVVAAALTYKPGPAPESTQK